MERYKPRQKYFKISLYTAEGREACKVILSRNQIWTHIGRDEFNTLQRGQTYLQLSDTELNSLFKQIKRREESTGKLI